MTTAARLVSWESGTDLVIELPVAAHPATVWAHLVDGENAGAWFAPFRVEGDGAVPPDASSSDADSEDEGPVATVVVDLGETELDGEILSCEPEDHVLIELGDFGVIGLRLIPASTSPGTDTAESGTVLVFTQTAADLASARVLAADHGPMWDTHLRLFAHSLGCGFAEVDEESLIARYSALEAEEER